MQVNSTQKSAPVKETKAAKTEKKEEIKEELQQEEKPMPSASTLQAMAGVKPHKGGLQSGKPAPEMYDYKGALDLVMESGAQLTQREFNNLRQVLAKGDEQTSNVVMQLKLMKTGDIDPYSVSCYWETGKMNDNLAKDLDMIYEARKAGKSVEDAYVPNVKSQEEGNKTTKIGDVFKVENEEKIYVKTDENESRQLDMDKKMFIKLFPPARRFTSQQQRIGDCYLVSTLGTLMNNDKARVALYEAFHQDGDDVTVKFKNGYGEYKYKDAKIPKDRVQDYSLRGSEGIRILEDAYGLDSVNKADVKFREIMTDKIAKKREEVEKAPMDKKAEAMKSLKGHQQRLNDYLEAKADPNRKIVVCRDDNYYNIYYEEDENGLKFADLAEDPDNAKKKFKSAADFYRGSLGGYNFEVMERFGFGGFRQWNLNFEEKDVKKQMMKDNFNKDFVMMGGTRAHGARVENPVAEKSGIYGFHAYTLEPHKDKDGKLTVRCTNPWNTSYDADISYDKFLEYYDSVSIVDVNSYGKDLPLNEQPFKYGKNGIIPDSSNEKPVIWYNNKNKSNKVKA
ncbi:hypothetical protein IKE67_01810 [bacterium]|nr:hypothetical protein [bacterium]